MITFVFHFSCNFLFHAISEKNNCLTEFIVFAENATNRSFGRRAGRYRPIARTLNLHLEQQVREPLFISYPKKKRIYLPRALIIYFPASGELQQFMASFPKGYCLLSSGLRRLCCRHSSRPRRGCRWDLPD